MAGAHPERTGRAAECRRIPADTPAGHRVHDGAGRLGPHSAPLRDPHVSRARQRGVALLVAIVIFAFATLLAAAITYNKAMTARRAAATFTLEQALQAGMAAEALAAIVLEKDADDPRTETTQDWAQEQTPVEIEGTGIWIHAKLEDLSGRFNLNSVIKWDATQNKFIPDLHQLEIFHTLLADLDIDQ